MARPNLIPQTRLSRSHHRDEHGQSYYIAQSYPAFGLLNSLLRDHPVRTLRNGWGPAKVPCTRTKCSRLKNMERVSHGNRPSHIPRESVRSTSYVRSFRNGTG